MKNSGSFHISAQNIDCGYLLAHLSSAQDELLWSLFVRRPSVNIFKRLLL